MAFLLSLSSRSRGQEASLNVLNAVDETPRPGRENLCKGRQRAVCLCQKGRERKEKAYNLKLITFVCVHRTSRPKQEVPVGLLLFKYTYNDEFLGSNKIIYPPSYVSITLWKCVTWPLALVGLAHNGSSKLPTRTDISVHVQLHIFMTSQHVSHSSYPYPFSL